MDVQTISHYLKSQFLVHHETLIAKKTNEIKNNEGEAPGVDERHISTLTEATKSFWLGLLDQSVLVKAAIFHSASKTLYKAPAISNAHEKRQTIPAAAPQEEK